MLQHKYYGLRHDVWGLGVLSFFLFTGEFPFNGDTPADIIQSILNEEPDWSLFTKRKTDVQIVRLIKDMLIKDPNLRITIRNVMKDNIFKILKKNLLNVIFIKRLSEQNHSLEKRFFLLIHS